jgi:diacylglycerol O-acyltransferase
MASSERMEPIDTTWLRMERPTNLMVIVGLLFLAGPVDIPRLERTLADRLLAFRRFGARVERAATGEWWCDDPRFDIAHHIKRVRLPGRAGKTELEDFVADLASQPFDHAHPLWQCHIVEDYAGGAVVIFRIHHVIADGMALIRVMLSLTDERADAPEGHHAHVGIAHGREGLGFPLQTLFNLVAAPVGAGLSLSGQAVQTALSLARHPARAADYVRDGTGIAAELAYLLLMPDDSPTRFKGNPSGSKRVAWTDPIELPEVKAVSRALGCSVNDMLLTAVAGALRIYLQEQGEPTEGIELRALVPIDLRSAASAPELGNHFGILGLELPVGIESPLDRVFEVHRRMEKLKSSYEPSVTLGLLAALGNLPQGVQDQTFDLLLSRASMVMTNVPGPQQPRYLAGCELKHVMFWVPQPHNIGMGVSILSYNGQVQFGVMTDAAIVPDPRSIARHFKPEFEQLLYFVLMQPPDPSEQLGERPPTRRSKGGKRPRRTKQRARR